MKDPYRIAYMFAKNMVLTGSIAAGILIVLLIGAFGMIPIDGIREASPYIWSTVLAFSVVSVFITTGRYVLSDLKALKIGAYSYIIVNRQGRFWDGDNNKWIPYPYKYYHQKHLPKSIDGYTLEGQSYIQDWATLAWGIPNEKD